MIGLGCRFIKCEREIKIQGSVEEKAIAGQLALESLPGSSAFKAQREEPVAQTQTH
ncbi:hypothetical protein [Coleofasciculus sp. FACHB-SPT36]|uniref:hypothetical protein n=1 Tax=Cyanophyceae TaxID=3028117 RepID=UPI001A7ECE7C|nr:hypothetical protein [Coleofasciculus sp. FACHB-SPT36]